MSTDGDLEDLERQYRDMRSERDELAAEVTRLQGEAAAARALLEARPGWKGEVTEFVRALGDVQMRLPPGVKFASPEDFNNVCDAWAKSLVDLRRPKALTQPPAPEPDRG